MNSNNSGKVMKYFCLLYSLFCITTFSIYSQNLNSQSADSLITLEFEAFDQDMSNGWRKYQNESNYLEAAKVIDIYLDKNDDLLEYQKVVLNFHSGQNYAFADQYELAISRLKSSIDTTGVMLDWNPYVKATIAFLENDLIGLKAMRDTMTTGSTNQNGIIPNLNVVDGLIANFDSSYTWAYRHRPKNEKK